PCVRHNWTLTPKSTQVAVCCAIAHQSFATVQLSNVRDIGSRPGASDQIALAQEQVIGRHYGIARHTVGGRAARAGTPRRVGARRRSRLSAACEERKADRASLSAGG